MILPDILQKQGFSILDVSNDDFNCYMRIKRICYEKYVDEYFGGWNESVQHKMNKDEFDHSMHQTCFKKILLNDEIVGFFAYDEQTDEIGGISVQMIGTAQNRGVGSFFLGHITALSRKTSKPICFRVFKSNPARNLYKRFGFEIYGETTSHYLMRFTANMAVPG